MRTGKPVFERAPAQVVAPEAEKEVLAFWDEEAVFEKSISRRPADRRFVFYEGPPTANGKPGVHHVLTRAVKDLICRYRTMKGYRVVRKAGWDTHGLPVEIEVEKELEIQHKEQIEEYGVAEFNLKCRKSVFRYQKEWEVLTRRIGFWLDLEHPYVTCTNDYIESIWSILRKMWDAGLIYRGHKVLPYCARCGTTLSSHEVSQGYAERVDPSIYVKLALTEEPGTYLLVWTTTPWTLISNVAVAVHPDLTYLKVRYGDDILIIAEDRAAAVLGEDVEILERKRGADLVGLAYEAPFAFMEPEGRSHVVVAADFVSAEDGSGLVHTAPAFGEDDYELGRREDLAFVNPVRADGTFSEEITPYAGWFVIDANADIIDDLRRRGILLRSGTVVHTYPYCWRCDSPLIYYAHPSWFVKTTAFKDEMIRINQGINWYPPEYGSNRFGRWLENNVDWALSRERYWGTPLNIWICESCGREHSVGSIQELRSLALVMEGEIDLHRPWLDGVVLKCEACGGTMKRTPEVIDCWFDTGGMPYAQYHYPFENKDVFESQFPADFICEAVDQTRGWFYSMVAISTFMSHQSSFKNVMVAELILDETGQKMSKSRGNVVDTFDVIARTGADPLRWYLYASSPIWLPKKFSVDSVVDVARKVLGTLRNVFAFFTLYANIDGFDPRRDRVEIGDRTLMDRWLVSRLNSLSIYVDRELENYDVTRAARRIQDFIIDDLSNWYVRRSRRRYWRHEMTKDKISAYATLYEALVTLSGLAAPFLPFVTEEIYRNLVTPVDCDAPASVHLCDYPTGDAGLVDESLEAGMDLVMRWVSLVRAARNRARIKVKQPLGKAKLARTGDMPVEALMPLLEHLKEEVNLKEVTFEEDLSGYVTYEVVPRFDLLGPRLGGRVKAVKDALARAGLDAARALEDGKPVEVALDGETVEIKPDEVTLRKSEKEGWLFEGDGTCSIVLDTTLTPDLLAEGRAREIVSGIQNLRKQSGFDVTDSIRIHIRGDELTGRAVEIFSEHIKSETLALSIDSNLPAGGAVSELPAGDGEVSVVLERTRRD
jgi:isoleucyl-tRNA synthetase